jgi:crotonobetainyl-CoA:carnitine CoA-transferase CaiB-like acyl-CoA transferase
MTGTPIKMSRTPGSLKRLPPKYGEHSAELLTEFGFSSAQIQELIDQGVVLTQRRR